MESFKVYIYTLSDPNTKEIRYVGKTKNLEQRKKNHSNRARDKNTHKRNWINKLKKQGLRPVMEILDEVDNSEWKFWEKYWIAQVKAWGFRLVNYTEGGDGLSFGNVTSFKKGIVPWNKGTAEFLTVVCAYCSKEFQIQKSFVKASGRKYCNKICRLGGMNSRAQYPGGVQPGYKTWNKGKQWECLKRRKPVYQYDRDTGEFIKQWETAKQAATELQGSEDSIGACARGKSKTSAGFVWTYTKVESVIPPSLPASEISKIRNKMEKI